MSQEGSEIEVDPQVAAILRALAPEEIDMLRDAFIFMDKDSDGFVSKNEMMNKVAECVGAERFPPLLEYLTPLFSVADKDKDNRLSLTEFLMSFADGPGVVPAEVINNCVSLVRIRLTDEEISTLQENFRLIDVNEDGYVDAAELETALRTNLSEKFPDLTDANFQEIVTVVMASADADRDGKLSLSEFIRSFQEDQGVLPAAFLESRGGNSGVRELTEEETQVLREAFAVLDKNNDGYVDFVDLYSALWESLSNSVEDKNQIRDLCDLIMVTADRKKNGRLSVSEFIRGFLQNMSLMQIPVAAAHEKVRASCERLQQMHESGELDQLVMVFEDLDSNGDGYLDRAEMVAVLTEVFQGSFSEWDDETLATVMTAIVVGAETHDSGRLSLEEFIRSFVEGPGVIPPEVVSTWRTPNDHSLAPSDADLARVAASLASLEPEQGAAVDESSVVEAVRAAFPEDQGRAEALSAQALAKFTAVQDDGRRVWVQVPPELKSEETIATTAAGEEVEQETKGEAEEVEVAAQQIVVPPIALDSIKQNIESSSGVHSDGEASSSYEEVPVSVRGKNGHPAVQAASVRLQDVSSLHLSANDTALSDTATHAADEGVLTGGDNNNNNNAVHSEAETDVGPDGSTDEDEIQSNLDTSAAAPQNASDVEAAAHGGDASNSGALIAANVSTHSSNTDGEIAKMPTVMRTYVRQAYDSCYDALFEEELRALFRKYDTENRGYLDREWFKQVYASMEQYGLEPTKEDIDSRFGRYSHNKDKVFFNEFCVLMLQRVRM